MLPEQLGVPQAAISMRLYAMVQKIGKWVPHELNEADGTTKHMPNSACQTKKKVVPASDCDRR